LGHANQKGQIIIATTLSTIVIDGESSDRVLVLDALADRGFRCEAVSSPSEAAPHLARTDFDAVVVYERAAGDGLYDFVSTIRDKLPAAVIIVVQTEYDGQMECSLFDLNVDDVIACEYSPSLLAMRAELRAKRRLGG
jgi:DNA-binding response OmpR family regulator